MKRCCEVCNRPLEKGKKRFCSKSCCNKYWSNVRGVKHKESLNKIECKVCGKLFQPVRNGHIYCTDKCKWSLKTTGVWHKKTCIWCHSKFETKFIQQKYCIKCGQYRSKGHNRISPLLRRTVWNRQDGDCFLCNQPVIFENAIAHHLDGEGQGENPDNSIDNLAVMHKLCHKGFHQLFLNFKDGKWYITGDALSILGLEVNVVKKDKDMGV